MLATHGQCAGAEVRTAATDLQPHAGMPTNHESGAKPDSILLGTIDM
jgi:hypothetical protein